MSGSEQDSDQIGGTPEQGVRQLPVYDTSKSNLNAWWDDFSSSIGAWRVWSTLARMEVSGRHRRFLLGVFWVPLGMAVFVFALGYVYSYLRNHQYSDFTPYLAAGMIFWTIIQSSITQGMSVFVGAASYIKNVRLPFHYYVLQNMFNVFYNALLAAPVYLLTVVLFDVNPLPTLLWIVPAMLIYVLLSFSTLIVIGLVHLRLRDIQTPLLNFMRLMFLITPVIWIAESGGNAKRAAFVDYNPLYHILEIARAPLLGQAVEPINWLVSLCCCAGMLVAAFLLMLFWRPKLHYWV